VSDEPTPLEDTEEAHAPDVVPEWLTGLRDEWAALYRVVVELPEIAEEEVYRQPSFRYTEIV